VAGGGGGVAMRVWAPTATSVTLHIYNKPHGGDSIAEVPMVEGAAGPGVWGAVGVGTHHACSTFFFFLYQS
jgi:hypothetical protein